MTRLFVVLASVVLLSSWAYLANAQESDEATGESPSSLNHLYFGARLSCENVIPLSRKAEGSGTAYLTLDTKKRTLKWSVETDLIHIVSVVIRLASVHEPGTPIFALR